MLIFISVKETQVRSFIGSLDFIITKVFSQKLGVPMLMKNSNTALPFRFAKINL